MILEYYKKDELCTTIKVDYKSSKVEIANHTDDIFNKAFGIKESPTIADFEAFMESRCVPRTRDNIKDILSYYELDYYDPVELCKKTGGKMAEDQAWIKFVDENYNLESVGMEEDVEL